jgi:hypothetical protein
MAIVPASEDSRELAPARGIAIGILLSLPIWAMLWTCWRWF